MGIALPLIARASTIPGQSVPDSSTSTTPAAPSTPASSATTTPQTTPATPGTTTPNRSGAPPAPPKPAPTPPAFTLAWKQLLPGGDSTIQVVVTPSVVVTAGAATLLQARRRDTGEVQWTNDIASWQRLAEGEGLVVGISGRTLHAFDQATGAVRWTRATSADDARLLIARAWLLVADGQTLVACRASDGQEIWRADVGAPIVTIPSLGATVALVGLATREMASVDLKTGQVIWKTPVPGAPISATVTDDRVFTVVDGGTACAHRLSSGAKAWCYDFHIPIVGAPLAQDKTVSIALYDNTVRALDVSNGALRRSDRLAARPADGAIVAGATTLIPLATGEMAMFAADGKALPRIGSADPAITQILEHVYVDRDRASIGTISIAPGGTQTVAFYTKTVPPPPATPAASPTKSGDTASGTPTGSPATAPETAAPGTTTAPPATGR
jgi:outer membrane protein assembly factor BamB